MPASARSPAKWSRSSAATASRSASEALLQEYPMTVLESAIERYVAARTLAQALECLREVEGATVLAGGTDLMPQTQIGRRRSIGPALVNIRRIDELRGSAEEGATARIGAL